MHQHSAHTQKTSFSMRYSVENDVFIWNIPGYIFSRTASGEVPSHGSPLYGIYRCHQTLRKSHSSLSGFFRFHRNLPEVPADREYLRLQGLYDPGYRGLLRSLPPGR